MTTDMDLSIDWHSFSSSYLHDRAIVLPSLRLSVSQDVSLGDFLLSPEYPIEKVTLGLFSKPGRWRRWTNNKAGGIGIFRTDYLSENYASRDDGEDELFDLLTPNSCVMEGSFAYFTLLCFQLTVPIDPLVLFWNRFRSHPLARTMDRKQPPVASAKLANLLLKGETFLLHF